MPLRDHYWHARTFGSDPVKDRIQEVCANPDHANSNVGGHGLSAVPVYVNAPQDGKCVAYLRGDHVGFRCSNKGRYEFEGRAFCLGHHPPTLYAKRLKKRAIEDEKYAARQHRWKVETWVEHRDAAYVNAFNRIAEGRINDPAGFCQMIIEEWKAKEPKRAATQRDDTETT